VPFERDTDVAVIYAHLSETPPKLTDVRPELPAGLDAVIAKGLDKSPERRFQSCSDLMSAARVVIDAAGPLADTVPGRGVPAGGRLADVATAVGRKLPTDAAPTVVPDAERRSRMLLAGLDQRTQAIVQVAVGDRCEVEQAGEGDDLLETIRDRRPDLLVLDWNAPALASRDVLEELRADPGDARVEGAARGARQAGAHPRGRPRRRGRDLGDAVLSFQLQVKLRKLLGADAVAI
jgi:serine/threonine-protein kinase